MYLTRRRAAQLSSLAALTCIVLTGCNRTDNGSSLNLLSHDDAVVATLTTPKGASLTITEPQFYSQLQNFIPNSSPQSGAPIGQTTGRLVLQQLLLNLMVEGLAQDEGVAPTDAEINTQYSNIELIQNARNIKPFDQALTDAGLTPQLFKDLQVKPQLAQLNLLTKGVTVTDADVEKFYNANKDKQFTKPARVHIKRIVVATLPEAQEIAKAIAGGQTFESQVSKSLDKSSPDGDVMQWVPVDNPDPRMAAVTKPIKSVPVGGVSAPITLPGPGGQNSYWLVKVMEKKDKETAPLSEVKDLIRANLLQQKAQADPVAEQNLQQQLHDFQSQAKITVASAQYAPLAEELTHPRPLPPPAPAGIGSPFSPSKP